MKRQWKNPTTIRTTKSNNNSNNKPPELWQAYSTEFEPEDEQFNHLHARGEGGAAPPGLKPEFLPVPGGCASRSPSCRARGGQRPVRGSPESPAPQGGHRSPPAPYLLSCPRRTACTPRTWCTCETRGSLTGVTHRGHPPGSPTAAAPPPPCPAHILSFWCCLFPMAAAQPADPQQRGSSGSAEPPAPGLLRPRLLPVRARRKKAPPRKHGRRAAFRGQQRAPLNPVLFQLLLQLRLGPPSPPPGQERRGSPEGVLTGVFSLRPPSLLHPNR